MKAALSSWATALCILAGQALMCGQAAASDCKALATGNDPASDAALTTCREAVSSAPDDGNAAYLLGLVYRARKDFSKMKKTWLRASELGDEVAALALARDLTDGKVLGRNFDEALALAKPFAEKGSAEAQVFLGQYYAYLTPSYLRDNEKAFHWFSVAADQGNAEAIYQTGHFLDFGRSVPEDNQAAIARYEKAAALGHARSINRLARMYELGDGTKRDIPAALSWLNKLAALAPPSDDQLLRIRLLESFSSDPRAAIDHYVSDLSEKAPRPTHARIALRSILYDRSGSDPDFSHLYLRLSALVDAGVKGGLYEFNWLEQSVTLMRLIGLGTEQMADEAYKKLKQDKATGLIIEALAPGQVPEQEVEAVLAVLRGYWLKGETAEMIQLAEIHAQGHSTPQDPELALYILQAGMHDVPITAQPGQTGLPRPDLSFIEKQKLPKGVRQKDRYLKRKRISAQLKLEKTGLETTADFAARGLFPDATLKRALDWLESLALQPRSTARFLAAWYLAQFHHHSSRDYVSAVRWYKHIEDIRSPTFSPLDAGGQVPENEIKKILTRPDLPTTKYEEIRDVLRGPPMEMAKPPPREKQEAFQDCADPEGWAIKVTGNPKPADLERVLIRFGWKPQQASDFVRKRLAQPSAYTFTDLTKERAIALAGSLSSVGAKTRLTCRDPGAGKERTAASVRCRIILEKAGRMTPTVRLIRELAPTTRADVTTLIKSLPAPLPGTFGESKAKVTVRRFKNIGAEARAECDGTAEGTSAAATTDQPTEAAAKTDAALYSVELTFVKRLGPGLLRILRKEVGMPSSDARSLLENLPATVATGLPQGKALVLLSKLQKSGATGRVFKEGEEGSAQHYVELTGFGESKMAVAMVLQNDAGHGAGASYRILRSLPAIIASGLTEDQADALLAKIEAAGGTGKVSQKTR